MKWFPARHWGVRGDYRLLAIMQRAAAPEFFGKLETRFAHRVFGALLITY